MIKKVLVALPATVLLLGGCSTANTAKPSGSRSETAAAAPTATQATTTPPATTSPPVDKNSGTASLKSAVEAYSREYLSGNGYAAYKRLSKRCADQMDKNYFEGLTLAAKETYGNLPIRSYAEKVNGSRATVSYTYDVAPLNQANQPWVKESGKWKYDHC